VMYSAAALQEELTEHEGLKLKPYICTSGKLTIGIGRNLDDNGISEGEAQEMFWNDIDRCELELDEHLPWWRDQSDVRQRALLNLCFNLGIKRLLKFKNTLAAWEKEDYEGAAKGLTQSLWFKQVGRRGPAVVAMVRKG
jgi:lysozyme